MFKLRTPSPALLVAVVALFVALSGSAVAAGIVPLAKRAFVADNAKKLGGKTRAQLLAAARGARGPQGLPGAKGDTGLTGAAGPAGPQGAQGAQGAKGDQGDKGDKGDVGDGIHLTGTVATVGDLPATGSTGDAYLVGDHLYAWDGTQWVDGGEIHAGGASLVGVRTAPFTIDPGDSVLFTVSCAPGEKALSGGFTYPPSPALVMAADTLPTDDDSGWQLDIINFDDSTTVTGTLEVVCTR